jgi:hypothetical protein
MRSTSQTLIGADHPREIDQKALLEVHHELHHSYPDIVEESLRIEEIVMRLVQLCPNPRLALDIREFGHSVMFAKNNQKVAAIRDSLIAHVEHILQMSTFSINIILAPSTDRRTQHKNLL